MLKEALAGLMRLLGGLLYVAGLLAVISLTMGTFSYIWDQAPTWKIASSIAATLVVLAATFVAIQKLFSKARLLSESDVSASPAGDVVTSGHKLRKGAIGAGVVFLTFYGLSVFVLYSLNHPTIFHAGSGLQPQDTDFMVGRCQKGYNEFPEPGKGQYSEAFRYGLQSLTWEDDGRLHIVYDAVTNCAAPFNYGGYSVSGNKLHLEYSIAGNVRAACDCGYVMQYRISGLERRQYEVDVHEVSRQ